MTPLFDIAAFTCPDDGRADAALPARQQTIRDGERAATRGPMPVDYWVRGVFRHGEAAMIRTVHAVSMRTCLDADVARFVAYLKRDGWLFPEGRAMMVELLGVGADDGTTIRMSGPRA